MLPPREDRTTWNDNHMLSAIRASWRSPDPNSQVGSAIVNPRNCLVGTGYNAPPRGIDVNSVPWDRDKENPLHNKYAWVVHAEKNGLVNATSSVEGCDLYVTMFPCNECATHIIQEGIRKVIYLTNPYKDVWWTIAAATMLAQAGIPAEYFKWDKPGVVVQKLEQLCQQISS